MLPVISFVISAAVCSLFCSASNPFTIAITKITRSTIFCPIYFCHGRKIRMKKRNWACDALARFQIKNYISNLSPSRFVINNPTFGLEYARLTIHGRTEHIIEVNEDYWTSFTSCCLLHFPPCILEHESKRQ